MVGLNQRSEDSSAENDTSALKPNLVQFGKHTIKSVEFENKIRTFEENMRLDVNRTGKNLVDVNRTGQSM